MLYLGDNAILKKSILHKTNRIIIVVYTRRIFSIYTVDILLKNNVFTPKKPFNIPLQVTQRLSTPSIVRNQYNST